MLFSIFVLAILATWSPAEVGCTITYVRELGSANVPGGISSWSLPVRNVVPAGDTIIVALSLGNCSSEASSTAYDSSGNVYESDYVQFFWNATGGSSVRVQIFSSIGVQPLSTSSNITVSVNSTSQMGGTFFVFQFSGISGRDQASGAGGVAKNFQVNVTTTQASEMFFAVMCVGSSVSWNTPFQQIISGGAPGAQVCKHTYMFVFKWV